MQGFVTTPGSVFGTFVGSLLLGGTGLALLFVPISVAVLGAVPQERGGSASAWINLAVQLGGSTSIALMTLLVDRRETFHQSILAGSVVIANAHLSNVPTLAQLSRISGLVNGQATVMAYADTFYMLALIAAIAVPLVFIMRKPRANGSVEVGG